MFGAAIAALTAVKIGDEITAKLSLRGIAAQGSSAVVGNVAARPAR